MIKSAVAHATERLIRAKTQDSMMTFDQATIDSAGAFVVGELERLDQRMNMPLASVSWARDMPLRTDVSLADEASSFTNSAFAAPGGIVPNGKNWAQKTVTALPGIELDIGKTLQPLTPWAMELGYDVFELASSQKVGRPIDSQKFVGLDLKYNMDIDEQVYIGDTGLGVFGLVNNPNVSVTNAPNGASGFSTWSKKTPNEILADVNNVLTASWARTGYSIMPRKIGLPPVQYSYLVSTLISTAGNQSIMQFLMTNSLANAQNGTPLEIVPIKWLTGRGTAGADRMISYTQDESRVRFPLVPMQRLPLEYRGLRYLTTYYAKLGVVEFPYAETVAYLDGI